MGTAAKLEAASHEVIDAALDKISKLKISALGRMNKWK